MLEWSGSQQVSTTIEEEAGAYLYVSGLLSVSVLTFLNTSLSIYPFVLLQYFNS